MTALELRAVSKAYPSGDGQVVALDDVELAVGEGEVVALVGPSGSGKSTLLAVAGGLTPPSGGEVVVAGVEIFGLPARDLMKFRAAHIGFVFQDAGLVPYLTARENLIVMGEMAGGRDRGAARRRAVALVDELGLTARADVLPARLSGSERQRVAIGRALMNDPGLVLIDEPTSSLDTGLGHQVMALIRDELHARGSAAVVVTHDARMGGYADRTLGIVDGTLGTEVSTEVSKDAGPGAPGGAGGAAGTAQPGDGASGEVPARRARRRRR